MRLCYPLLPIVLFTIGCSKNPLSKDEEDRTRQVVQKSLDTWKSGEPAEKLRGGSPPIHMSDPDWDAGAQLIDYEIASVEKAGQNPRCAVKLVLRDSDGEKREREVIYDVAANPQGQTVIGRDPLASQ
jgi:hypothetical protein